MSEAAPVELIEKIAIAREWAKKHFNADNAENSRLMNDDFSLVKPSCFVGFPSPDTMLISPSVMGKRSKFVLTYRLAFRNDDTMAWNCQDYNLPSLEVMEGV